MKCLLSPGHAGMIIRVSSGKLEVRRYFAGYVQVYFKLLFNLKLFTGKPEFKLFQ